MSATTGHFRKSGNSADLPGRPLHAADEDFTIDEESDHETKAERMRRVAADLLEAMDADPELVANTAAGVDPPTFSRSANSAPDPVVANIDASEGVRGSVKEVFERSAGGTPVRKSFDALSPIEKMTVEHARLVKAFQAAEGRPPTVEDDGFWQVWAAVVEKHTGVGRGNPHRSARPAEGADDETATLLRKASR